MPRPVKWRKVEFVPDIQYFKPQGIPTHQLKENILKVEELEAVRLKDCEGLEQEECAKKMGISRQTFQRILNSGRQKIADSLVNGKAIRIEGGNFTENICAVKCEECEKKWDESFENVQKIALGDYECPYCGSTKVQCVRGRRKGSCPRRCSK